MGLAEPHIPCASGSIGDTRAIEPEVDIGIGQHRDVKARDAVLECEIGIAVLLDRRTRRQAHQPRRAQGTFELRQHLAEIGHSPSSGVSTKTFDMKCALIIATGCLASFEARNAMTSQSPS
jgi:hypothetical protein